MGQTYSTILGTLASPQSMTFHYQVNVLVAQRIADCATGVLTPYYFDQSAAGSNSGGGGTGTIGSPYLCRHGKDLLDLFTSLKATNLSLLLKCGAVFDGRGGVASFDDCFGANNLLSFYSTGNKPVLSDFTPENTLVAGVWAHAGGLYTKTFTAIAITWIRPDEIPATNLVVGTETAWARSDTLAGVSASDGTINVWYQDPITKVVTVKTVGDVSPAGVVQMCRSTVFGIHPKVDGFKMQGLCILGNGLQNGDTAQCNIAPDVSGTQVACIIDCESYYSGPHAAITYSSTGIGGAVLYQNLKLGYCLRDGAGTTIGFTSFNAVGGQECVVDGVDGLYGTLPEVTDAGALKPPKTGALFHWHTGGSPAVISLICNRNAITRNHVYGFQTNGLGGNNPLPSNHAAIGEYRAFVINEKHEGGAGSLIYFASQTGIVRIADNLLCQPSTTSPYSYNSGSGWFSADNAQPTNIIFLQPRLRMTLASCLAGDYEASNVASRPDLMVFQNGSIEIDADGKGFSWDGANDSTGMNSKKLRWFNMILSVKNTSGAYNMQWSKNQAAGLEVSDTPTGGMTNCAFWRSGDSLPGTQHKTNFNSPEAGGAWWGINLTGGYVELSAAPTFGATPAAGGQIYQTGTVSALFPMNYWIDADNIVRMMPTTPSIGSVQTKTFTVGRGVVNGRIRHRRLGRGLCRS